MAEKTDDERGLFEAIIKKDKLHKVVCGNALEGFSLLKEEANGCVLLMNKWAKEQKEDAEFYFEDKSEFEFSIKFSGDILIFTLHTNVFEFSRDHIVMRSSYIKEDLERSYCGCILIYNFLSDSITQNRLVDLGYLIGRVFVNKDKHYFLEGKQELGVIYNNFTTSEFDKEACGKLIRAAMKYSSDFDLLVPPYDEVKEINVADVKTDLLYKSLITAKRLGFRFHADTQ